MEAAAGAVLSSGVVASQASAKEAGKPRGKAKKASQVAAKPVPKPSVAVKPPDITDYATGEAHSQGATASPPTDWAIKVRRFILASGRFPATTMALPGASVTQRVSRMGSPTTT